MKQKIEGDELTTLQIIHSIHMCLALRAGFGFGGCWCWTRLCWVRLEREGTGQGAVHTAQDCIVLISMGGGWLGWVWIGYGGTGEGWDGQDGAGGCIGVVLCLYIPTSLPIVPVPILLPLTLSSELENKLLPSRASILWLKQRTAQEKKPLIAHGL